MGDDHGAKLAPVTGALRRWTVARSFRHPGTGRPFGTCQATGRWFRRKPVNPGHLAQHGRIGGCLVGVGSARSRGSLLQFVNVPYPLGRHRAREGFTRSGRHRTGRQQSAPRARGVHPVRSASDGSATVGSASKKGLRKPEGLTRVVRLDAGSCDTPATGCHALRTLMSRGEAACHKRVRLMSLAHAGWVLARSVVTRDCLRVTGS